MGGLLFVDMALPFILHSAPKIFTALADTAEWIITNIFLDVQIFRSTYQSIPLHLINGLNCSRIPYSQLSPGYPKVYRISNSFYVFYNVT